MYQTITYARSVYIYMYVNQHKTDLCIVFNEKEEDDVLSHMLDGQVQGVVCVGLEHVIEQRGTQISKIPRVEVVL